MTTPTVLRVVRCAGCAELEPQVTRLQGEVNELLETVITMAELQNFCEPAQDTAGETAMPRRKTTVPELMADAVIRDRNVVTLPPEIREAMGLVVGDGVRFKVWEDGTVTIQRIVWQPAGARV